MIRLKRVLGAAFGRLGFLSSQESVDVASLLTQIQSNIGFDRLQLMREMSTTGAGLGQVSNLELTQLNNSLVALQQELTPELLAKNLETVQTVYTKILNDPIALAIKEAPTKEEAMRLITLHNEVQAGSSDSSNIIFDGGDGNYSIKQKGLADAYFEITAPDGKVYEVEGKSIEGAKNAFRQMMAQNEKADKITQDFINQDVKLNEQGFAEGFFTDPTKQYTDPTTGETVLGVTSRARLKEEIGDQNTLMGNLRSFFTGAGNMASLSGQDELFGQLSGQFGSSGTEAEKQKFGTEFARANLEVAREQNPVATAAGEIAGGLAMPLGKAKTTLGAMGKGGMYGSAYGAAYGFGSGEEDFADRYNRAMQGGTVGGLFTAASVPVFNIVRSGGNKTFNYLFSKNQEKPTLESLKQLKNKAYDLVDKAGIRISPEAIDDMFFKVSSVMDSAGYVKVVKLKTKES